ncbi:MAG TPA: NUDIX domain-containing protein [Bacilli bacterium]|nr:NUDIX domain-containing protein [Bacilli bacterium]
MTSLERRIRAGALIIENDAILLVEFDDENGVHYNLPAGGVEPGETVAEAARREAREEAGVEVEVGPVAFVYEYEPKRNEELYGPRPSLSVTFACTLKPGSEPRLPDKPDENQTGVKWVPLAALKQVVLYPEIADDILAYAKNSDIHAYRNYVEEKTIQEQKQSAKA